MSDSMDKKQVILIEYMISDIDVFTKCLRVVRADYFEKPLDRVIIFVKNYFEKHHGIPDVDMIEAETGVELYLRELKLDSISWVLEEIEEFCKKQAMYNAIMDSVDLIDQNKHSAVSDLVRQALTVRIDDSVGIELFKDARMRVETTDEATDERGFGIPELDKLINKIRRGEVGITYGTTGAGKSVLLGNMAYRLSKQGLNGIIISLELKERLYAKRLDTIFTGLDISQHKESGQDIEDFYETQTDGYGNVVVKFLKSGSTASDVRTVVMEYCLKYGHNPDFIIVDYMQLMKAENYRGDNKFDADEEKIFALQNIAVDFDAYMLTAGQMNRDGADIMEVTHKHVAGGLSAVNGSDWSIVMVASEEDMDNNQFQVKQLKIRNGARTMKPITLYRSPVSLRVSDQPTANVDIKSKVGNKNKKSVPSKEKSELAKKKSKLVESSSQKGSTKSMMKRALEMK